MENDPEVRMGNSANEKYQHLPIDVRDALFEAIIQQASNFDRHYENREDENLSVATMLHVRALANTLLLRIDMNYLKLDSKPVIQVMQIDELSREEFEQSLLETNRYPFRLPSED